MFCPPCSLPDGLADARVGVGERLRAVICHQYVGKAYNTHILGNKSHTSKPRYNVIHIYIRASVDALCRDGASEISRDPRTKRLQTRRESLARPSKQTNNNSYLAVHKPSSFLPASSLPRENPLTRDFHNFVSSYSSSSSSSSSVNPLFLYQSQPKR